MSVLVTQRAPDFTAAAVLDDGSIINNFKLSYYRNKKIVLFFYPLDFTFVCPSEILAHNNRINKFKDKGVQVIGISIDSQFTHNAWRNVGVDNGGIGMINFPLVADTTHVIANSYGIMHPDGVALRASFLIDEKFYIRHQVVNDLPLGRNVDEMLRMVDALDFHTNNGEVCPAGWNKGDKGMRATAEGVSSYLSEHSAKL